MALAVLAALVVVGGCARVQAGLVVQPDDTVGGEIVLATPARGADDAGPTLTIPAGLVDEISVSPYRQDDYAGWRLRFSGLSFAQVSQLTSVAGTPGERVQLTLRRVGNRVLAEGSADLGSVSADRADFQLKITFPGEIIESDGEVEAGTVTWVFAPGEKGEIRAVAGFSDPDGPSPLLWTLLVVLVVSGATATVSYLARQDRNPPVDRALR